MANKQQRFRQWKNHTKVSGGAISGKSKKMLGCDECNWMELKGTAKADPFGNKDLKTGSTCPRCKSPTVRLFDSNAEFTRAQELKLMQKQGLIEDLQYQVRFKLNAPDFETKEPEHVCTYVADFTYNEPISAENNLTDFIVEDVKGAVVTDIAALKMKWFEIQYGIPVRITTR